MSPGACRGWETAGHLAGGPEPSLVSMPGLGGHRNAGCALVHAGYLQPRPSPATVVGGPAQGQRDAVCGMLSASHSPAASLIKVGTQRGHPALVLAPWAHRECEGMGRGNGAGRKKAENEEKVGKKKSQSEIFLVRVP